MKRGLIIAVGLLAGVACDPEHTLTEVLQNKDCSNAEPPCVSPYVCHPVTYKCVMPEALPDAGGAAGSSSDDLSPAGAGGAPQELSTTMDPVAGGQSGAAGSESLVAGAGGLGSMDPPVVDTDAGCDIQLFRDVDGDGYGSPDSGSMRGCPRAGWVERGDDCFDAEVTEQNRANQVHPEQAGFFDRGYALPSGDISFDYDCSGQEEPDPNNTRVGAAGNCTTTAANACGMATGFVPIARSGSGINDLCGSTQLQICMQQLQAAQCVLGALGRVDPFQCH
ncbi:MAG TPA: hypothetical protein VFS67_12340 [Polyangiaceae bacterium]|nr:hypothetical protein [Polyangiaceae bacterium]